MSDVPLSSWGPGYRNPERGSFGDREWYAPPGRGDLGAPAQGGDVTRVGESARVDAGFAAASPVVDDDEDDARHITCDHGRRTLCGNVMPNPEKDVNGYYLPVGEAPRHDEGGAWCWTCLLVQDEVGRAVSPVVDDERTARIVAAAECLYDNRVGWDDGRAPQAGRAFWAALGMTLGRDMAWLVETDPDPANAELERRAALHLLDDMESP